VLSTLSTMGKFATGRFRPEDITGALKGAGQGLSLGIYEPQIAPAEADAARGGRFAGGMALGAGAGGLVRKALAPLGRPLITTLVEALGLGPGLSAASAGLQGGDPLEAAAAGTTALGTGQVIGSIAQRGARLAAHPMSQAVAKEQANATATALRERIITETARRRAVQQDMVDSAQSTLTGTEVSAYKRAGAIAKPVITPESAFDAYNIAAATPEILPKIPLKNSSKLVADEGHRIVAASEGLPKGVQPTGLEKLTAELGEQLAPRTGSSASAPAAIVKQFGKDYWDKLTPESKANINAQLSAKIGVTGDDLSLMSSPNLRLDQVKMLVDKIGPMTSSSPLASKMYANLMEDLRTSGDPMATGVAHGFRLSHQVRSAGEVQRMLRPVPDEMGRDTISSTGLKKLTAMFRNYDRNPKLLSWNERLTVEGIPAPARSELLKLFSDIYIKRTEVTHAEANLKATKPREVQMEVTRGMPEDVLKHRPMRYQREDAQRSSTNYALSRALGMPIPWAVLSMVGLDLLNQAVFRVGLTPAGRSFVRALYADRPPSIRDTAKISAIVNYLQSIPPEGAPQ
jgi:hypothetical protein